MTDNINEETMTEIWLSVSAYGLQVLAALAIFFIGKWVAHRIQLVAGKALARANMDATLIGFLTKILYVGLLVFIIIAALGQLGVQTTSLAAAIAAAGLAVGLALQGSLSNFAAGVLIIIFRFFKAGDYVEVAGVGGTVSDVSIFTTVLITPDNKRIIIPNGTITSDNIINYSAMPTRRIDMVIGVGYGDDLKKVHKVLERIISSHEKVLKTPAHQIAVSELADSSVNFVVRPWVKTADYWAVRFALTEEIKTTFDKEGISIPFPQRDLHMIQPTPEPKKSTKK
ncbi:MAG: mechanosensitive ion channel protein [Micavibrio sp.]|nr:mechanosensitive ion channel protein [Micavibrio sp.]